ncbi:MAG TPA: hypothetical protein VJB98_02145 [Candidatus Paceibacterota bacterium]
MAVTKRPGQRRPKPKVYMVWISERHGFIRCFIETKRRRVFGRPIGAESLEGIDVSKLSTTELRSLEALLERNWVSAQHCAEERLLDGKELLQLLPSELEGRVRFILSSVVL